MRQIYTERLSVLLESARERLAGLLEISNIEAGLQTLAPMSQRLRGGDVVPLSRHSRGAMTREGLQLGFAAVERSEIRRGVRELAIALEGA